MDIDLKTFREMTTDISDDIVLSATLSNKFTFGYFRQVMDSGIDPYGLIPYILDTTIPVFNRLSQNKKFKIQSLFDKTGVNELWFPSTGWIQINDIQDKDVVDFANRNRVNTVFFEAERTILLYDDYLYKRDKESPNHIKDNYRPLWKSNLSTGYHSFISIKDVKYLDDSISALITLSHLENNAEYVEIFESFDNPVGIFHIR